MDEIRSVVGAAFETASHASGTEARIIDELRAAGALTLSLVAEIGAAVVGHVAVSPVRVSGHPRARWYGVGPLAVALPYRRRGIGAALMRGALSSLRDLDPDAEGCVLLGDPAYYARFGFVQASPLELPGVPATYFQALSFGDVVPAGQISYHRAFGVGTDERL